MSEPADDVLAAGVLHGLDGQPGDPVRYALEIGDAVLPVEDWLERELRFETNGSTTCSACGRDTEKRYGGGYCYRCFTTLARCDLCVVSPDRCHFDAGTCREPAWGEAFCMGPHFVYLANSGGAKVGITRPGNVPGRFIDQGASEAIVVMTTQTRMQAGCVEKALGRYLREQTDWRALVAGVDAPVDLTAELARVRRLAHDALTALDARFPGALAWHETPERFVFRYPVVRYDAPARQMKLAPGHAVGGRLLGARGGYLLFEQGVLNVRALSALHVVVRAAGVETLPTVTQMELF